MRSFIPFIWNSTAIKFADCCTWLEPPLFLLWHLRLCTIIFPNCGLRFPLQVMVLPGLAISFLKKTNRQLSIIPCGVCALTLKCISISFPVKFRLILLNSFVFASVTQWSEACLSGRQATCSFFNLVLFWGVYLMGLRKFRTDCHVVLSLSLQDALQRRFLAWNETQWNKAICCLLWFINFLT